MTHTASDFGGAYELGMDCQRVAAKLALDHRYEEAVREYLVSITHLNGSDHPKAAERISFAQGEVERLSPLVDASAPRASNVDFDFGGGDR